MKIYIYKLLLGLFLFYIFFELTIGIRIDNISKKIDIFTDEQKRFEIKEKIKSEMRKGIEKDNYFTEEERDLISRFIKKIKKELDLASNQ